LRREQSSHHQGYTVVTGNASSGHVNLLVQPGDEER
jgi:hypothetical protein